MGKRGGKYQEEVGAQQHQHDEEQNCLTKQSSGRTIIGST
jgi:hypothetical protein